MDPDGVGPPGSGPPDEAFLASIERELRDLPPGTQRAVGGGVYMRLDRSGRRRFQFRGRTAAGQAGGTHDSWQEANDALQALGKTVLAETLDAAQAGREQIRAWTIERYAEEWWRHVLTLDVLTQQDYRRALDDLLPLVRGVTLAQLETAPLLADEIKDRIKKAKTHPPRGRKHQGKKARLHGAAADKLLKLLRAICQHALERQIISHNPFAGLPPFSRRRGAAGDPKAPGHRPIKASEVISASTLVRVGAGMRGNPLQLAQRRLIPELIATGMRPSDILAMRHRWWRDRDGPRTLADRSLVKIIHVDAAVKSLAGHLLEGEPKTGERDLYLFEAIEERLELIYRLQGCDLDALVIANRWGELLSWANYRSEVWYPALHREGIADGPDADARGAFHPYLVRHWGVTTMLHAERPEGGSYSRHQVAKQFGHTVQTLDRVYANVPDDLHGIAGKTMDEIIRNARRDVWGPMPGDPDHQGIEYDLLRAQDLTGISRTALAARLQRGSLPGEKRKGKWFVTRFGLQWHGLLPPETAQQRDPGGTR